MATSLAVPVAYITVLVTALAIFSRVYRRRKIAEKRSFEAWFPSHPPRDLYISILSSESPPDNLVKSALLLRAIEDVKRIWRIRDDKMALTSLHQRGLLGDDTKARFDFAEKELEAEILDVVQEANSFKQGWGGLIFATATEMAQAERTREAVMNIPRIRQREEKRMAIRRKYLPDSTPPQIEGQPQPQPQSQTPQKQTPPTSGSTTPAASQPPAAAAAAGTGPGTGQGSGTTTPAKPAQITAIEKEGTAALTPGLAAGGAGGSGNSSTASTPSKTTPSGKKKKGKK